MTQPTIHLYAGDHSAWAQSVMILLAYKKLKFTINQTPDIKSIIHNRNNVTYIQIPVLHYKNTTTNDDIIMSDSIKILQFINKKHPLPKINDYKITDKDIMNLRRLFNGCSATRIKGGFLKFFYSFSLKKDVPTSYISLFFRPLITIYMCTLCFLSSKRVDNIAEVFTDNTQIEEKNSHFAKNTFIFGVQYFASNNMNLYSNRDKQYPSLLDFALLGQFQMVYSGLSSECVALTIKYFPTSKKWLNSMHEIVPKYNRFYTKGNNIHANYLEQIVYWLGLTVGLGINLLFALIALVTRGNSIFI
eukprot:42513_1